MPVVRRKNISRKRRKIVKHYLEDFGISLEEFERSLAKLKKNVAKGKSTSIDEKTTLKEFCLKGSYNYKLVFRVMRLWQFF